MAQWSVYMVRCGDGTLYTGIATDVRRRVAEHTRRDGRGAKYLRGRGPLRLVFVMAVGGRSRALRIESRIKRFRKARKEALLSQRGDELFMEAMLRMSKIDISALKRAYGGR